MQRNSWQWPLVAGILLIGGGVLLLLNNFGWLETLGPPLWAGLFLLGAVLFLNPFLKDRQQWWAIIPAGTLASLAATILISQFRNAGDLAGAVFLAGLGITFFAVYIFNQKQWWALIPGGAMALLSGIVLISILPLPHGWAEALPGAIFLAGLGVAFLVVYFVRQDQWWALIPGGCLLVLSGVPIAAEISWAEDWIPLILFGGWAAVFLILHALTQMRWSLWVSIGLASLAVLIRLASGPTLFARSTFALALIAFGGYLLLRKRAQPTKTPPPETTDAIEPVETIE